MVRNKEKYEQALQLRSRGFTMAEIASYCAVSKSTVSEWLKNNAFSAEMTKQNTARAGLENGKRLRLMAKSRGSERVHRYADAAASAKVEFVHYQQNPLFMAGVSAYIAAGDDSSERVIRMSHVSPELHRLFVHFAVKFLGVDKNRIHIWLQLYGGASEERAMRVWSKTTTLPLSQFYKNHFVNKGVLHPLHSGVGNTIIGSTYHKQKLKAWVKLAKKSW